MRNLLIEVLSALLTLAMGLKRSNNNWAGFILCTVVKESNARLRPKLGGGAVGWMLCALGIQMFVVLLAHRLLAVELISFTRRDVRLGPRKVDRRCLLLRLIDLILFIVIS